MKPSITEGFSFYSLHGLIFALPLITVRLFHITIERVIARNDDDEIKKLLHLIIHKLNKMANEIEDLTAEVAETKGIMQSAKVLIEGFAAALTAAGTNPAKLKALKDDLNAGSEELAGALTANPLPGEVVAPPVEPPL